MISKKKISRKEIRKKELIRNAHIVLDVMKRSQELGYGDIFSEREWEVFQTVSAGMPIGDRHRVWGNGGSKAHFIGMFDARIVLYGELKRNGIKPRGVVCAIFARWPTNGESIKDLKPAIERYFENPPMVKDTGIGKKTRQVLLELKESLA